MNCTLNNITIDSGQSFYLSGGKAFAFESRKGNIPCPPIIILQFSSASDAQLFPYYRLRPLIIMRRFPEFKAFIFSSGTDKRLIVFKVCELAAKRIKFHKIRRIFKKMITAPTVFRSRTDPRFLGVSEDIAKNSKQICIVFYRFAFVSVLEQMADTFIFPIEPT